MNVLQVTRFAGLLSVYTAVALADSAGAPVDWARAQRVDVQMVDYAFVPDQLRFHTGVPYQLHLVNAGKEGHDFTAPDFFKSIELKNADVLGGKSSIYLNPGETADIYFVADHAGLFAPRCADHDWAGMKATIIVD